MPCLALSAKPESVSMDSDPSTHLTLCSTAHSNRQKSSTNPAFIQGSAPEIATLIQQ